MSLCFLPKLQSYPSVWDQMGLNQETSVHMKTWLALSKGNGAGGQPASTHLTPLFGEREEHLHNATAFSPSSLQWGGCMLWPRCCFGEAKNKLTNVYMFLWLIDDVFFQVPRCVSQHDSCVSEVGKHE